MIFSTCKSSQLKDVGRKKIPQSIVLVGNLSYKVTKKNSRQNILFLPRFCLAWKSIHENLEYGSVNLYRTPLPNEYTPRKLGAQTTVGWRNSHTSIKGFEKRGIDSKLVFFCQAVRKLLFPSPPKVSDWCQHGKTCVIIENSLG